MNRSEFEIEYAKRSGVTVEWLHKHNQYGVPCNCEEEGCKGWQMKSCITPPNSQGAEEVDSFASSNK